MAQKGRSTHPIFLSSRGLGANRVSQVSVRNALFTSSATRLDGVDHLFDGDLADDPTARQVFPLRRKCEAREPA